MSRQGFVGSHSEMILDHMEMLEVLTNLRCDLAQGFRTECNNWNFEHITYKQTCSINRESTEPSRPCIIAGPQSIITWKLIPNFEIIKTAQTFPQSTNPTTIVVGPASQT